MPLTQITLFWLGGYQLNNETLTLLADGIRFSFITTLAFDHITLIDSVAPLGPGIRELEVLQLDYCNLTENDLIALVPYLPGSTIQALYLAFNNIGDRGVLALTQVLPFTDIILLSLEYNNITDIGAQALADVYASTRLNGLNLFGNNVSSSLLTQIESFQWQQYCQDQLCHSNAQYNGYTAPLTSSDPSPIRHHLSYRGRNHLKPSRRYDVFDSDVKRDTSKKITWGAGSSIEVIEDDPLAATTDTTSDHSAKFHVTTESLPTWTPLALSSPNSSESSAESLLTPATAGAMMVGMVGLSLLLYKNVTLVRIVVNTGCQLLQRCFCRASDSPQISTNHYSFHSQNKTRKAQYTESHLATTFNY